MYVVQCSAPVDTNINHILYVKPHTFCANIFNIQPVIISAVAAKRMFLKILSDPVTGQLLHQ